MPTVVVGGNAVDVHLTGVVPGRDFPLERVFDLRNALAGDACPRCSNSLEMKAGLEVGHVFKLGTKYSEKLKAFFLDEAGKQHPAMMGCYGIGVTRTMQAVIEQCNDKDGIIWPMSVAPYRVCITPLSVKADSPVMALAEKIYAELMAKGVDVILDDRDDRPGVKFKDSELVGFPLRLGIGEKSLAKGEVELKPRGGAMMAVKVDEALAKIMELVDAAPK
jgi:prolyl-tRNA synthetase